MDSELSSSQKNDSGEKAARYTFRKKDRLASNIVISDLAKNGKVLNHPPFRLLYSIGEVTDTKKVSSPVQVAIAVPKRNFKKAVDRNLIKRRIREAYRLNNRVLHEQMAQASAFNLKILLVYVSPEIMSYQGIEEQLIALLRRLVGRIEKAVDASASTSR